LRETAELLRRQGYVDAADEIDPNRITGQSQGRR
jgi:hypothetical protein